jgi:outer membrane protein OmpU
MKTIMKTLLVSIASLSLMFSVNAGEFTVNGTAKATYNMTSGVQDDNGIGVTNELNFTASGEMDNGYSWSYSMELDPSTAGTASSTTTPPSGSAINDDTALSLKMNDMGTVKVCVSECGNNKKYAFDNSAYTKLSDTGYSEGIVYPTDLGAYASVQYHTPELPFSTTASIGYGQGKVDGQSGNTTGVAASNSLEEYSLVTKPIDGLTLSASYYEGKDYDDGLTTEEALEEGGAWGIKYAYGNATLGYGKSYISPETTTATRTAGTTTAEHYKNTGLSVGYAVNDSLSVSYTREKSDISYQTSATATNDIKMNSYQLAYSMGGATLSLARADYDNAGYAQDVDVTETILAVAFAF